jgi:hypothetical protein
MLGIIESAESGQTVKIGVSGVTFPRLTEEQAKSLLL